MELDSGKNWLHAANLGAKAVVYIDRGESPKQFFKEKFELSPLQFPRFWMSLAEAEKVFGDFENAPQGLVAAEAQLFSQISWQIASSENIYCFVEGTDPELKERLIMVEAFYDSTATVAGLSPGADEAVSIATDYGYDEINLNVGCPSDRVQSGAFGACLMAQPERVAECVAAMKQATSLPVTVKHRTGIDEQDSWEQLVRFVRLQLEAGADAMIIHARKAWLQGLNPKQNREIPPLQYAWVYRLKQLFGDSEIIINGSIKIPIPYNGIKFEYRISKFETNFKF